MRAGDPLPKHSIPNAGTIVPGWIASCLYTGLRPGDVLVLLLGALAIVLLLARGVGGGEDRVLIRQDGRAFAEVSLRLDQVIEVPGPLGITRVEIRGGRVRVLSDPGPQQICVRQGWLAAGESALCLPNRVSVERGRSRYDSLSY